MVATKEQERTTLEKIKQLVAELGENSYLATAFTGAFELAEENIENDAAHTTKYYIDRAIKAADTEKRINEELTTTKAMLAAVQEAHRATTENFNETQERASKYAREVEREKESAYHKGAQMAVRKYPATEYKGRMFKVYQEIKDPYENQKPVGEIELSEGIYIGGDLYIVPMQVFATSNPALLKVVFMVAGGCDSLWHSVALQSDFAEITDNNIRTSFMTTDRKLYYHSGASDCEGVYDLTPQPWRLEGMD
jgi:hypothetical protein